MRRRAFITLLGGAAATWPLAARAQQAKLPTIGFLASFTLSSWNKEVAAFVQRLNELGWSEGRTITTTFSAKSADSTRLFSMPITRGVSFDHLVGAAE
jgi:putative tryptophan/tyrosine transport system substrate-binding protein